MGGKYLSYSAFLIVPMCITMTSTSILNSMGFETKTLLYYIIGAILMLLSIWFLPKYMGIYSLLVGFTFVYGLTTLLNLRLIHKNSPLKLHYFKFLWCALLFLIPTAMCGLLLKNLLSPILGSFFTVMLVSCVMVAFNGILYVIFNLIDVGVIFKKLKRKKKVKIKERCA